jgi:transglutaminase-like putative cysteine protease
MKKRTLLAGALGVGLLFMGAVAELSHVSTEPTAVDRAIALEIFGHFNRPKTFRQEIAAIQKVQEYVLAAAPRNEGIPLGQRREAADVLRLGHGLCYDRSRAMEMVFRALGFRVRHASLYTLDDNSIFRTMTTPQVPSHAIAEVKTSRGWLLVDSNDDWIALTRDGKPMSAAKIAGTPRSAWRDPDHRNAFYDHRLAVFYGLYSRHGGFYAPYVAVPDLNIVEVLRNLPDSQFLVRPAKHLRAHGLAPEGVRRVERRRGDADMVEAAEFHKADSHIGRTAR